jgi:hypothetical protein
MYPLLQTKGIDVRSRRRRDVLGPQGGGAMRATLTISVVLIAMASAAVAAVPVHQWSQQFGSSDADVGNGIAADGNGNVLVTGHYGPGGDAFVAKYDANGIQQWIRWFGPGKGYDVAVDASGNVFVTGALGTYPMGANPIVDILIKKFDASGTEQWSKTFIGPSYDEGIGIATDLLGNVVMTGRFTGSIDFGGGPRTSVGIDDIIVAKFDANGAHLWSRSFGSTSSDYGLAIVVDESGNVFVTGAFHGSVDFGGGTLMSAGGFDMFVAKYDAGGIHQWSHRYGSPGIHDYAVDVALDAFDDIVVTGTFTGAVDFGGGPLTSVGSGDIFIAKYDATGTHQWSKHFGTLANNQGTSLAVDVLGDIVVTGYFNDAVDFGGGSLSSAGQDDIFLAKFDADGTHEWSERFGDTSYDYGGAVAMDPAGNISITGAFIGAIDFGGGPLTSAGWEDMYVAKFAQDPPVPTLVTRFEAVPVDGSIVIRWDVQSTEVIEGFALYRRADPAPVSSVIADDKFDSDSRSFVDTSVEPGKTYHYELLIRTGGGSGFRSPVATATMPRAVTALAQNFPNPFNPQTTIAYTVSARAPISIEIFDASGAPVRVLDQGVREAGRYSVEWDGRDAANRPMSSGVYFYRLSGVKGAGTRKMVLVK